MKTRLSIGIFSSMLSECNGTAEAARRLVIGLGKAGHDVHVFAPSNGVTGRAGVTFHKTAGFRMSREPEYFISIPLIRYIFNNKNYYKDLDVCHAITPLTLGALALDIAKIHGKPKIITHHSPLQYYAADYFPVIGKPFSFYAWYYERFIYNRFHVIHVPTLSKKELILGHKMREPIFALTNGILDNYFVMEKGAKDEVLDEYKIPKDKKIILYAGRQGPEKNIEAIIRALRNVRALGVDAHLILAGGGPHIKSLRSYAEKLGILEHLTQTGWVKHIWLRKIYNAADVCTLYNDIEAQGLVLLEAMAQGTPCIGKNSFGIRDVIVHEKTGFLVQDENDFAEKLKILLSDDELQKRFGKEARKTCDQRHRMTRVIKVWEKVYKFLINDAYPRRFYGASDEEIAEEWKAFCAKEPLLKM
ncbi:MAG: glycosyltransferase [Promethearchaeota archaeon]